MIGLISLPYEVLSNVVDNISFDDAFNLGRTCKHYRYLLTEESISKTIVQTKVRYSNEALAAKAVGGGNARALRRVAKRRDALATANPFVVATIGFCDAYLYCKGVLCYTLDDRLRLLDLHHSAQDELVISIPGLLTQALSEIDDHSRGVFQVLYYSDRIVSCLYKSSGPDPTAWLIAFHLKTRGILIAHELESIDKIFVRHNKQYLYYGTHSEIGTDGNRKWVIQGYDFKARKWFDQKMHLPDMVGSEIGSTICFELHKDYFYALSNQTSFEVEEIDWTSFYHCIRFPLNSPCKALLEKTENKSMWRRQHQEGPIDDRWTNLSLDEDESSGQLKIVEARKEWYLGSSRSQRTYYTTDIIFPRLEKDEDLYLDNLPTTCSADAGSAFPSASRAQVSTSADDPASFSASTSSTSTASSSSTASTGASNTSATPPSEDIDTSQLPDVPLRKLIRKDDHPHHINAPARLPQNTHPGNDGSSQPTFTLAKSRIRTYHTSCSTFIDLVDDPLPTDWQGRQRLRLRAGSRSLGPPLLYTQGPKQGLLRPPSSDLDIALTEMYRVPEITYWPAAQNPDPNLRNEHDDAIYKLLNPPSHLGNVEGTADERSMVYVTGARDEPQALIFIAFDPAIKLAGLKRWGGLCRKGVGEGPHIDGRATGYNAKEVGLNEGAYVDVGERDRTVTVDRKGKGKERATCSEVFMGQSDAAECRTVDVHDKGAFSRNKVGVGPKRTSWAWKERAMYQDINLGYYFGLDRVG
ncbi:hypothetical protein V8E51_005810 [Hyaloscypha variabilis]